MNSIGFVVSTLGRIEPLGKLLTSLEHQLIPGDQIVVVAQGNTDAVRDLVKHFASLPIAVTTSERGLSLGRNVGVQNLPEGDFILQFPNDNTWFPSNVVSHIRAAVSGPEFLFGGMTVFDDHGPRANLPSSGTLLNAVTVWKVLEVGLLVRRSEFEKLGGFDPAIGSGANTPWQSGEGTDLLLRALAKWPFIAHQFLWLPSTIAIGTATETHDLSRDARRQKLIAYGRGMGWVARQHNCPVGWRLKRLLGRATVGIRRPEYEFLDGWWGFLGVLEGMLGRTFVQGPHQAVSR
jgi:glycosyltransferase involved in cell wall biosynthesis